MKKIKIPVYYFLFGILLLASCQKNFDSKELIPNSQSQKVDLTNINLRQTKQSPSTIVLSWMKMQIHLMSTTPGIANVAYSHPFAYSGIALYEAVVPGMPSYQSIAPQLNGLSGLPQANREMRYHWPSCANAALAFMNKQMFPTTSAANQFSIDSLENVYKTLYKNEADAETINRSIAFGKAIAQKVFDWSQTDGYLHANDPYTAPIGPGLWVPPVIPLTASSTPYWGNLRTIVPGSIDNTQPGPPIAYSTDPSSDFYKMVKQVYDVSQTLTPDQTAWALFWRDVPGVTTPGHYLSILEQVLEKENATLDKAAVAYALCAITVYDAGISCWKTKYNYNLVRPVTYIRNVLGHATWNSLLDTPAHPEYSAAHAVLSAANAEALTELFGGDYKFTDHTYDYLGFAPRSFSSFREIGEDAGNSRLYAGIHYQPSINTGLVQGRKVARNIKHILKFKKGDEDGDGNDNDH